MITIEKVETREGFQRLKPLWNPLLESSSGNTITLTWEWLSTWWEVFGEGRELYLLLAREGGRVIGIAPLLKRTVQHYGLLPFRRLEFLASGEDEADEICSEYLDFIIERGREPEVLEALYRFLNDSDDDWDEMLLTDVAGDSVNLPLLERLSEAGGTKYHVVREQTGIYVPLPDRWENFLENVSREFRRKIQRDRRVAKEIGADLRVIDSFDSSESFESHFETLINLHQARWTARGLPGVFSSEKFTRFHRQVAPKLIDKGWVNLFILSLGGRPVAALYDFIYGGKMIYYQSGLDIDSAGLHSPGILIRSYAIEKAIRDGLTECDFLKGDVTGYKSGYRGQLRNIVQLRLARSRSKEAVYAATARVVDGLRSIKRSLVTLQFRELP
ncbi:MAG TPA: GNAT family N-acetyltransferase [Blastocatellia bacterium]|nr:GNAT family N-acetyltransferase [Blastocatellia bacterium]